MKKIILLLLPMMFTAQACNYLLGKESSSGVRGVFVSSDSGETWEQFQTPKGAFNISGSSVNNLFIEKENPTNLMAATLNAGLIVSDDAGKTWYNILPNFSAYDAFIKSGNSQEIFVGGAYNKLATIFKSQDRGGTWVQIYNEPKGQAWVTTLVPDPNNSQIMYAGLSTGSFIKSLDGGESWKSLAEFNSRVTAIALPSERGILYVLTRTRGLQKSTDDGSTWTQINVSDTSTLSSGMTLNPRDNAMLYVTTNSGLYHSLDRGVKWTRLSMPVTSEVRDVSAVTVNTDRPEQIFVAIKSTIYRSDDKGQTWRTVALPTNRIVSSIKIDPREPNRVYAGLK